VNIALQGHGLLCTSITGTLASQYDYLAQWQKHKDFFMYGILFLLASVLLHTFKLHFSKIVFIILPLSSPVVS